MGKLENKVALVTGGSRGIGRGIAITLAREGADVAIGDLLSMDATAAQIRNLGRRALTIAADVSKKADVRNLVDTTVAQLGRIDILVNNAGISRHAEFLEMSEDDWDAVLNVNLKSVFLCTQAAGRYMVKQGYGKVVNISSTVGIVVRSPDQANYAAAKAGVIQLTKVAAIALGPHGVNVNAIAPGLVITDLSLTRRTQAQLDEMKRVQESTSCLRRVGVPADIANLALFLASDDSSFITGQVIVASGRV